MVSLDMLKSSKLFLMISRFVVQAAMAADYAIGQFRFLERLLLVHGRWCYRRISLMVKSHPFGSSRFTICVEKVTETRCVWISDSTL